MPASLCIKLSEGTLSVQKDITFYTAGEWSPETEALLVQQVHDLLSLIRPMGISLHLILQMEVTDLERAALLISRRNRHDVSLQTQSLTRRELEILGLIMNGYTNNDIAKALFISYETVKSHRKNILTKTGARNTAALINYYHQTFFEK